MHVQNVIFSNVGIWPHVETARGKKAYIQALPVNRECYLARRKTSRAIITSSKRKWSMTDDHVKHTPSFLVNEAELEAVRSRCSANTVTSPHAIQAHRAKNNWVGTLHSWDRRPAKRSTKERWVAARNECTNDCIENHIYWNVPCTWITCYLERKVLTIHILNLCRGIPHQS